MNIKKAMPRVITALILIAAVLPPFIIGGAAIEVLAVVFTLFASYEIASIKNESKPEWLLAAFIAAVIEILMHLPLNLFAAGISIFLTALFLLHIVREDFTANQTVYTFVIALIVALAWRGALRIYDGRGGGLTMIFVAVCCYVCDTGAWFVGSMLGKHKMIPRISPNKTWEGSAGGYLLGAAAGLIFGLLMIKDLPSSLIIAASFVLPAVAQIGDLAFSSIKRAWEMKDFGSLLPGHGGVLDRIDSLVFCLMIFNALMLIWGV